MDRYELLGNPAQSRVRDRSAHRTRRVNNMGRVLLWALVAIVSGTVIGLMLWPLGESIGGFAAMLIA